MISTLRTYMPVLDWARRYNRTQFTCDLIAAIIVTIMLIPQSLAYALLADRLRSAISRPGVIAGLTRAGGLTLMGMAQSKARTSR